MNKNLPSPNGGDDEDESLDISQQRRGLLDRRRYLRLTGTALASAAALTSVSGSAAAAECETVIVGAGETERRVIDTGESLENVLFDVSASGATLKINARGSNWAIRNVGVRGTYNGTSPDSIFRLQVDKGSTGVFENVYLGGGAVDNGYGAVFVPTDHAGTLTMRAIHVRGWPDNGVYASAPGRDERNGQEGVVRIVKSYARNNNIAGFRLGTDGSVIRDSVIHVDSDVPNNGAGKENARGAWVKEGGTVDVRNCDILLEHPDGTYCVEESDDNMNGLARVSNSEIAARDGADGRFEGNVRTRNVGNDPDVTPPAAVPMSPKEACTGNAPSGPTGGKELTFDGLETDIPFRYSVTVSGDIGKGESDPTDNADSVSGNTATGAARLKQDIFRYTGVIKSLSMDFDNGQTVSVDRSDGEIIISGPSNGDVTTYTIAVSDDIDNPGVSDPQDVIDRGRASGALTDGEDAYRYSGDLEGIDIDGVSMVRVTPI